MDKRANIDYLVPLNIELKELGYCTYITNKELEDKIIYLYSHPKFMHRVHFNNILNSGTKVLARDMANVAVNITRYYIDHRQQYAHSMENIHWQILTRMWKQTYRHCIFQQVTIDKYKGSKVKLLTINNGLFDCIFDTVMNKKYKQVEDTRIKREGMKHTDRKTPTYEGGKHFESLCSIGENEMSSLL